MLHCVYASFYTHFLIDYVLKKAFIILLADEIFCQLTKVMGIPGKV